MTWFDSLLKKWGFSPQETLPAENQGVMQRELAACRRRLQECEAEKERLERENQTLRQGGERETKPEFSLTDHSFDLAWEVDHNQRLIQVSSSTYRLLGYREGELLGKAANNLLEGGFLAHKAGKRSLEGHKVRHKNGQLLSCQLYSLAYRQDRWIIFCNLQTDSNSCAENLSRLQNFIYQGDGKPAFLNTTTEMDNILSSQLEGVIEETEKAAIAIFGHVNALESYASELMSFMNKASAEANSMNSSSRGLIGSDTEQFTDLQTFIQQTEEKRQGEHQQVNQAIEEVRTLRKLVAMVLDISDRTNVLALNARIAAARAGVHGQKFAVVAQEVRHLAEQTGTMARRIDEGIELAAASVERVLAQRFNSVDARQEEQMLHHAAGQITALGKHYSALLSFSAGTIQHVSEWNHKINNELMVLISKTQFQDITRQRIQQVCRALEKRTNHAKTLMDAMQHPEKNIPLQALRVDDLMEEYVMASQRRTHQRLTGQKEDSHSGEGEIILF
ncbi:MAG: hypothetical protein G8345_05295 [Magnetococcales bacterium]|nr:hypothetical protein [Magnetococcales bacterium]